MNNIESQDRNFSAATAAVRQLSHDVLATTGLNLGAIIFTENEVLAEIGRVRTDWTRASGIKSDAYYVDFFINEKPAFGTAIPLGIPRSPADISVVLADCVQDDIVESYANFRSWPSCPEHPSHPMWPRPVDQQAIWQCGSDPSISFPIGSLR